MQLRKLEQRDAPLMLEWMHDESVVRHMSTNFKEKTIDDCLRFIAWAGDAQNDVHLAVVDEKDEYMGTVSLKHIHDHTAEFAITVRKCAMGKGFSQFGMASVLEHAISELKLQSVYWCVSCKNERAVRFYDKNGYTRTRQIPGFLLKEYTREQIADFIWYVYPGNK